MSLTTKVSGRESETLPPAGVSLYQPVRAGTLGILGAVLIALVGLVVVFLSTAPSTDPDPSTLAATLGAPGSVAAHESGPEPLGSDELARLQRSLSTHAAALLRRDERGWAAALDTDPAAAAYRARQRGVFRALETVPLAQWRYTVDAGAVDPAASAASARRFHARAVVVRVEFRYALSDVDQQAPTKTLWLTAVRRSAGWRLTADTDGASSGRVSWRGPWDFGPLIAHRGTHTLVLTHPAHAADAATFGRLVDRAVPVVRSVWGDGWQDHVAVLIPDTDAEFAAVTGDSDSTADLAAVAVADGVTAAAAVVGARIVLNPRTLARLDAAGRQLVVQHELTHVATRASTPDRAPVWVVEGFADYVGNLGSGQRPATSAAELAAEVRRGRLPAALPAAAEFAGGNPRLAQAYEEAWLANVFIARRVGRAGLVRFYRAVNAAVASDATAAVPVALRSVLHTDLASFTRGWRRFVRAELAGNRP